jgi:hypothetical protein
VPVPVAPAPPTVLELVVPPALVLLSFVPPTPVLAVELVSSPVDARPDVVSEAVAASSLRESFEQLAALMQRSASSRRYRGLGIAASCPSEPPAPTPRFRRHGNQTI